MKILILHRVPYFKIEYARGIPHDRHEVTYFGTDQALATLPDDLPCERVPRPGTGTAFDEARRWLTAHPRTFDRIISMSEYELLDAARLRAHLGVTGAQVEQVTLTRDKVLMKQAAHNAGIRVPRFAPLQDLLQPGAQAPWQGRTVLKPHRGASSEDVLVYDTPHQALTAVTERRTGIPALDTGTGRADFQAEEFITGPIRHFDGLIQNGQLLLLTASQYIGTCLHYAQGQPIGSYHIPYDTPTRTWVTRALAATGIENGSFHLEAIVPENKQTTKTKETNQDQTNRQKQTNKQDQETKQDQEQQEQDQEQTEELVFLEVGNRVGGADVVATVELATGIHLPTHELRIHLGEPLTLPPPPNNPHHHGWFAHPGHHLPGHTYHRLDGTEPFRTSPHTLTWNELQPGTPLPHHITYQAGETILTGIIATPTPQQTHNWITHLFTTLTLHTHPPTPTTPEKPRPQRKEIQRR